MQPVIVRHLLHFFVSFHSRHKSTSSVKAAMMKVVYEDMVLFESDVQVMEMTNQGGTTDTERGKTTSEGERADTSFWIDEQERCT